MVCAMACVAVGCEGSGGGGEDTADDGEEWGETGLESGEETGAPEVLEIAGAWESEFSAESITSESWDMGGIVTAVVSYDNDTNWVVTQNANDAEFSPSAFNKTIWMEPTETGFAYCTAVFGLATLEEAEAAATDEADASDLDGAGCGGFPWTFLTPAGSDSGE
jgi:hypothetical protein